MIQPFAVFQADVAIQSGLGLFFSHKFRSAVLWAIYQKTGDANAKTAALARYDSARQAWSDLAAVAAPVYKSKVTYGHEAPMQGHWTDRLKGIAADIAAMNKGGLVGTPSHPGPAPASIIAAQGRPARPTPNCHHTPPNTFAAGQPLSIVLNMDASETRSVKLYYRHVNQADTWQFLPMEAMSGHYQATIQAAYTQTDYPLQYYFGLVKENDKSVLFPGFDATLANQPYFVVRLVGKR